MDTFIYAILISLFAYIDLSMRVIIISKKVAM
jgi:hypothetical protein